MPFSHKSGTSITWESDEIMLCSMSFSSWTIS
jgi:hypothetical protein